MTVRNARPMLLLALVLIAFMAGRVSPLPGVEAQRPPTNEDECQRYPASCPRPSQPEQSGVGVQVHCPVTTVPVGQAIPCVVLVSVPQPNRGETITEIKVELDGTGQVRLLGGPNGATVPEPAEVTVFNAPGPQAIEVDCSNICNDPARVVVYQFIESITGEAPGMIFHKIYINGVLRHTSHVVITVTGSAGAP